MTWGTTDAKATKKYLNQVQKYRFQVLQEELVSDAKGFKQVVELPLLKNKRVRQHLPNVFAKFLTRGNEKRKGDPRASQDFRTMQNKKSCQLGSVVLGVYTQGGI